MRSAVLALLLVAAATPAAAQEPAMERLTFDEAVRRAMERNPSVERAASGIIRAESLLQQVRSISLPSVDATFTTRTIGPVTRFAGEAITPRTQLNTSVGFAVPLLTPVRWAQRAQAGDQVLVAQRTAADVRREIAFATAQAYLAIITERRVLELNTRARDNAKAHFDYAQQRYEGGVGSRLNALRAQQELSGDEARVEDARLAVRRAQEALGVLTAADGPVDAAEEPAFAIPADVTAEAVAAPNPPLLAARPDIQLLSARTAAAERVVSDAWKDYLPAVTGSFEPQVLTPSGLFAPTRSWSASILFSVPLFDAGQRRGVARERQSLLNVARAERVGLERQARSEVRTALEAVRSTERALASARAAAEQAEEVVRITDLAFRAGATTNIEVIDAQRRARDAETAAAIAEDAVRRARLELLLAVGQFPR
ncbi:MAG TPA: TolC family protein [Vicinamibacterales bacterium]|nr:TolC family protein [Vicinamibacterales bacterium]